MVTVDPSDHGGKDKISFLGVRGELDASPRPLPSIFFGPEALAFFLHEGQIALDKYRQWKRGQVERPSSPEVEARKIEVSA